MENKKIDEIKSALKSITLKNQTINLLDSKLINGLRFEKNIIYFTLELLPEQLKDAQEIRNTIDKKLLCIEIKQYSLFNTFKTLYTIIFNIAKRMNFDVLSSITY